MRISNTASILSSFATIKSLNDSKTYINAYQVLGEFIGYIVSTQKLYSFTSSEMKNKLESVFGFNIPEAVVKTASRSLPYISRDNHIYVVDTNNAIMDTTFEDMKTRAEENNQFIIRKLIEFINPKQPDISEHINDLVHDLIAFLIDDQHNGSGKYAELISEFIIKAENDEEIQSILNAIREGSIIYIGINHNISETGSIKKPLTLFLGTEILFSLMGYNGEIHKQLAEDFYSQVRNANRKNKVIQLHYFADTKKEIEDFFNVAEDIVDRKRISYGKVAMQSIVNNCHSSSDVRIKKADFYHTMQFSYGITEDPRSDYYSEEDKPWNLESVEYSDPEIAQAWKLIGNINKLRKGKYFINNIEAEYLFVTNKTVVINASREQANKIKRENEIECINDYAISMDRITNILWYKLGYGFGRRDYPDNINAVLKARIVLSYDISRNVNRIYAETIEQYNRGEVTEQQLASRIVALRKKPVIPDEIEADSIEEALDFSIETILKYEDDLKNSKAIVEKQNIIIEKQKADNAEMKKELDIYKKRENSIKENKKRMISIFQFALSIIWKLAVLAAIVGVGIYFEEKLQSKIPIYVCAAIDLIGLVCPVREMIMKDFDKYIRVSAKIK